MIILLHDQPTADLAAWVDTQVQPLNHEVKRLCAAEDAFVDALSSPDVLDRLKEDGGLIIAVLFDGTSAVAKSTLSALKIWTAALPNVSLQAMNAKCGKHALFDSAEAVVSSIAKKLPAKAAAAPAAATAPFTLEHLDEHLVAGQGEILWPVSAPPAAFEAVVTELRAAAAARSCVCTPLHDASLSSDDHNMHQNFMVRRNVPGIHLEMRCAVCGNVDSGKSTLTSVLVHGQHDDGRGSARAKVFVHAHEAETGRTSAISDNHIGFDAEGRVVNHQFTSSEGHHGGGGSKHHHGPPVAAIAQTSAKICTLYDLAGHERYLKTTVLGMTRNVPDYACIVISANNGIQRMTKEHLGLCLALKLPFFVVLTRIDSTPANVKDETLQSIVKLMKAPTVKKLPMMIGNPHDVLVAAKNLKNDRIAPIFEVSNVTGDGLPNVLQFLNLLPTRSNWHQQLKESKEMIIDSTFFVTGVGTVVGGICTQGIFKPNDVVLLGPDGLGNFRPVQLKSIHSKGVEVSSVECGNDAAFCLKKEKRSAIRKGMVLVDPASKPKAYWQFDAEIRVLYHSTTIASNYEPVIHSQTVRQSARIIQIDKAVLRTGDHAIVRFQFLYRPEFMKEGQRIIFREGRTKGIGTITKMVETEVNVKLGDLRTAAKQQVRHGHEQLPAASGASPATAGAPAGSAPSAAAAAAAAVSTPPSMSRSAT